MRVLDTKLLTNNLYDKLEKTYRVGIQRLEKRDNLSEEVDSFVTSLVISVARGVDSVDTSAVLGPLALPETLTGLVITLPVSLHVVEQLGLAGSFEETGDVLVSSRFVAIFLVVAAALVGPMHRIHMSAYCTEVFLGKVKSMSVNRTRDRGFPRNRRDQ